METKEIASKHKLCNREISETYKDFDFYLFPSDFISALAYWVVSQNHNKELIIELPVNAYYEFIKKEWTNEIIPERFTYERISNLVSEDIFKSIPEIMALNRMKPDFIDLGALSKNVFYMICREQITQS